MTVEELKKNLTIEYAALTKECEAQKEKSREIDYEIHRLHDKIDTVGDLLAALAEWEDEYDK